MRSTSPIVDCGVHYVDIMCQITRARPVAVHAVGARLTGEIASAMYNYGHLHIMFDDGSIGWYEAGWGPMMSETAHFVKDMIGPNGSVSIVAKESADAVATRLASTEHASRNGTYFLARQKPRQHRSTDDSSAKERIVVCKDRRIGRGMQGCQRPVAFICHASRIDDLVFQKIAECGGRLEVCLRIS
jgi:predicted dehydrogenase